METQHPCKLAGEVDQQCPLLREPHLLHSGLENHSTPLESKGVLRSQGQGLNSPPLEGLGRSCPELRITKNAKQVSQLNSHTGKEDLGKHFGLLKRSGAVGSKRVEVGLQATRKRLTEA